MVCLSADGPAGIRHTAVRSIAVMPWLMVGVIFVFQPATMIKFYTRPVGIAVLLACIIWISIGIKLVNKLGEIKV